MKKAISSPSISSSSIINGHHFKRKSSKIGIKPPLSLPEGYFKRRQRATRVTSAKQHRCRRCYFWTLVFCGIFWIVSIIYNHLLYSSSSWILSTERIQDETTTTTNLDHNAHLLSNEDSDRNNYQSHHYQKSSSSEEGTPSSFESSSSEHHHHSSSKRAKNSLEDTALRNYIPRKKNLTSFNKTTIGAIRVVNLPFRAVKWNHVLKSILSKSAVLSQFPIERSLAIYGKDVDLIQYFESKKIGVKAYRSLVSPRHIGGHYMTAGGLGCFLSHIQAWEHVVSTQRPVLILEDDIELLDNFDDIFESALSELPSDFGLLYLADLVQNDASIQTNTAFSENLNYLVSGHHWGTFAYVISPTAAARLVAHVYPLENQVDSYMISTCILHNISVYRTNVNIVSTDNRENRISDVQAHVRSDSHQKFISTTFHVLDIPPMSFSLHKILHRLTVAHQHTPSVSIEVWDRKRLREFGALGLVDISDPYYSIELLRLKLSVLYANGGMCLRANFKPKHSIGKIMHDVHGFIVYEALEDGTYAYPILGAVAGESALTVILTCLQQVLMKARSRKKYVDITSVRGTSAHASSTSLRTVWTQAHKCMTTTSTRRFPSPGSVIVFPAEVLYETGYA